MHHLNGRRTSFYNPLLPLALNELKATFNEVYFKTVLPYILPKVLVSIFVSDFVNCIMVWLAIAIFFFH